MNDKFTAAQVWARVERATLVPVGLQAAWRAVSELVAKLWPGEVLHEQAPVLLWHSVAVVPGGETAAWLSWSLEPVNEGTTRVVLVHEEQVGPPAPAPELDAVLALLLTRCQRQ